MSDNSQDFDSLQERNQQVLNNISQLQGQEITLYNSLDDVNLTSEQKQILLPEIDTKTIEDFKLEELNYLN